MNTPMNWLTTAKVIDPERKKFWIDALGVDEVPIRSIVSQLIDLPGIPNARVYMLDIDALTVCEKFSLRRALAKRFGLLIGEVDLEKMGCPILAEGVYVISADLGLMMNLID